MANEIVTTVGIIRWEKQWHRRGEFGLDSIGNAKLKPRAELQMRKK